MLLELLADKVEDLCGYKPDLDACSQFLETHSTVATTTVQHETQVPVVPRQVVTDEPTRPPVSQFTFTYKGSDYHARSARNVMVKVFQLLSKDDESFLDRFAARKHGRTRKYLARDKTELYPERPDLCEEHSVEITPGWWMGTNHSRSTIQKIIDLAAEVAGLQLGKELSARVTDT